MSEKEPTFKEDTRPCSLAGSGRCCRERHRTHVQTRIDQGSKTVDIPHNGVMKPAEIKWQPYGEEKPFANWKVWQTHLEYDQNLLVKLANLAHNDLNKKAHYLDIAATRTAVHTPVELDCPLLKPTRGDKI